MKPVLALTLLVVLAAATTAVGVYPSNAGQPSLYVCYGETPQGCAASHGWVHGPGYFVYCYSSTPPQMGAYFCGGSRYGITHVGKAAGGRCGYDWYYVTCN